jgi:hypothetical protein
MKSCTLYFINGLTMTVLWFLVRVLGFLYLARMEPDLSTMHSMIEALPAHQAFTLVFSYFVGLSLQLFWFQKLLKGVLKVLCKRRSKQYV